MDPLEDPVPFVAPEPADLAPHFPGYEIIDLIATGGMGAVYRAVQKSLDRMVALKILPAEFGADAAFSAGFAAEAKAMAKLNHPNLIGVYDFGEIAGMPYIVMEFVAGKSIYHSAHDTAIDPAEVIRLVTAVCGGLAHAHAHGILHRDIKPSNILLTQEAEPKIGDFGLARPVDMKAEDGEAIYGTPGYTAPEVVDRPETVDHHADIFSVGVLLHELLTGKLPGDDPRPASAISGCDPRFDAIIRRATQPLPLVRYASATDLARELAGIARIGNIAPPIHARHHALAGAGAPRAAKKSPVVGMVFTAIALVSVILGIVGFFRTHSPEPAGSSSPHPEIAEASALDLAMPEPAPPPPPVRESTLAPAIAGEIPEEVPPPAAPAGGVEYGLFVKQTPEAWMPGSDGTVAGAPGSEQVVDAFKIAGVPFAADFRIFSKDHGGWHGWEPCTGRSSTAVNRVVEAVQFRFPAGTPAGKALCGRVFLKTRGWLRPVIVENYSVLGGTALDDCIQGIQFRLVDLAAADFSALAAESDADFNSLLPPGSSAVADLPAIMLPSEPILGRWMYSNNGSDEFTATEDGVATAVRRPPGAWTRQNPGQNPAIYQISWENGKWIDTMTANADGSRFEGHNQVRMDTLIFTRVDGVPQWRSLPKVEIPVVDGFHFWTKQGSSRTVEAVIIGKSADNSTVYLLLREKKAFQILTDQLVPEDAAIVRSWAKTANTPPPPRGWKPAPPK